MDLGQKPPLYVNASLGTEGQTNTNKKHKYAFQGYVGCMLPHSELWDFLTQTKLEITILQHADLSTRKHSKDKLIARLWENARKEWKLQLLGNTGADVSAHQACFQTTLSGKHNPWLQRTSSRAQNVWDNEGKPNMFFHYCGHYPAGTTWWCIQREL